MDLSWICFFRFVQKTATELENVSFHGKRKDSLLANTAVQVFSPKLFSKASMVDEYVPGLLLLFVLAIMGKPNTIDHYMSECSYNPLQD